MSERPVLSKDLKLETFRNYYYLKEELVAFCRREGLQTAGGKIELTQRIATYLSTGERVVAAKTQVKAAHTGVLTRDTKIETPFTCTQKHRAFFTQEIGAGFSFTVTFQKWLKSNAGKKYQDAVEAYKQIVKDKKHGTTAIEQQFEYNTYIRAFFADNKGLALRQAIQCWQYKKSLPGQNKYEKTDLIALE